MHSAGIGGGGFMTVYNRANRTAEVFDFREEAPGRANSTMYVNSSLSSTKGNVLLFALSTPRIPKFEFI